ncbi:MAG: FxLYD domain-containing protein [Pyrinomonadaceae bacterium]
METFLEPQEEKKGNSMALILGALVGIVLLSGVIWLLMRQPSMEDQETSILEGSFHEGSAEFSQITKDIIISTAEDTVQSPTGLGRISMYIHGKIRNKGDKNINGLEINVTVVDTFNQVLKERRVLVVPTKQPQLGPGETIDVHVEMAGFDKKDDRANIRWKVTAIRVAS